MDDPSNPNRLQGLWHGNLGSPGGINVILASNPSSSWSQLAYNRGENKLYAAGNSALYAIDKTTGATLQTIPLVGYTDSSGVLADIAVPVPEPQTYALVAGLGCAGLGLWRFRSRKP